MRLRGRFTLTLALAALVPISVAAVVTQQVVSYSWRKESTDLQNNVRARMDAELTRLRSQVKAATEAFATRDQDYEHPLIGALINELNKRTLEQVPGVGGKTPLTIFRIQARAEMRALSLDSLTVTGRNTKNDEVLVSPHQRDAEYREEPKWRTAAEATKGETYFDYEVFRRDTSSSPDEAGELVAVSSMSSRGVTVASGRKLTPELLSAVRRDRVDARIVRAKPVVRTDGKAARAGDVEPVPPQHAFPANPTMRIPLLDAKKEPVAFIEIAITDDLDEVLRKLTYTLAALALAALGVVVLIGMLVARRTARDLDALVVGSLAASRGDLEHRVPVRSEDEIGAVASAFNFMMEDLKTSKERLVIAERIAAWQDIARRLAHEIKNPLTPIQMAMDTLRKTWKKQHPSFDEILEESTTTVLQEADRLKHLVAEFSDFARMPKPAFQRIDLNEAVRSAISLYQGATPVETRLGQQLPQLDADKGQINQVLINLVENARDAIGKRPDGKIVVSTRLGEAGDRAMLFVEDNGPGVPPDLKDKVFAPYFTTKHAKGGTGLGLAIVHRIVSDHGGRIFVSDPPGGGARFTIELPLRNGTALLASRI